jgi:DNA-directed RNA polymerase subunit beta'
MQGTPLENTKAIADSIIKNMHSIFPVEVGTKKVEVKNVSILDLDKADPYNFHEIADIKSKDKTFGVSIYGDVELKDGDKVIDHKRMKLATAPAMAGDGTFIVQGSQFAVDKQLRLRPGIYSRIKQNGEIEAHVNPNGFKNLRLGIDPQTNKMLITVNQANINAIPVLRILGITDQEMRGAFGNDIFESNLKFIGKNDDSIKRFFKSVNPRAELPENESEIALHLSTELKKAKLDPKVTEITLGKPFEHLDGKALLRGFNKVVNVARGIEKPDDRDALAFKSIHSVEDFVNERLDKNKIRIALDIKNRLRKSDKLESIINSGHINQHVYSFFNSAALSEIPSQINPLAIINGHFKTTITGEGGIENEQAIMPESQALHPTHLGFLDPINTPESSKIGVTLNLAVGTRKIGNELYSKMLNVKNGKLEEISAIDAFHKTIALPGQELRGIVTAVKNGKQIEVKATDVTHQLPQPHNAFTMASQVLPALDYNQGNRAGMASRHINQAISLKYREAPLVQVKSSVPEAKGMTAERYFGIGHNIVLSAKDESGEIEKITDSHLIFKGDSGKRYSYPLYTHFDMQNKAYLHHEIEDLKPGMKFKKGEVIADSNFTKDGTLALGTNMRVAYMPWKGLNFEDGVVISETGAKKLTSNHLFQDKIDKDNVSIIANKNKFSALYPTKYSKAQLDKLDENGIAKPGITLNPGDPYALILHKTEGSREDLMLNRLHKSLVQPYKDMSRTWDQLTPGTVTRSTINTTNVKVHTKHESPAIVGDKIALRHGNKGIITSIIPDGEMPATKEGRHTEMLISPASVITRMSMGQKLESSASKIAEKTGTPYVIENFAKENQLEKIKGDLKKHHISDTEELIDPKTGKSFGQILVGQSFVEKSFKTAKANVSARDTGSYDIDNKPIRGGEEGSKAVDQLMLYGLISHGARGIINEVSTVKGDGNAQFWQNLQNGLPTPKPQIPFVYKKFEAFMHAAGINIRQDGNKKIISPLTDKQTEELAGKNEIKNVGLLNYDFEPIKGGLFDVQLTGGHNGQKWAKMTLAHPLVNPMYESAVKTLLGYKEKEFTPILQTKEGHDQIAEALKKIDIKEQIDELTEKIKTAPKTKVDVMIKKLKILKALNGLNMKPHEAYMTSVIPVVPPQFRPIFEIPGGHVQTHSLNNLYADLGTINTTIKELGPTPELTTALYGALGALQGVSAPITRQNEARGVKGALQIITGAGSPKHGFFQNKVVRKQQDLTGRATAVLNNNLNMDQLAIPEKIAKVIYKPFAIKELINNGYTHKEATEHIDEFNEIGKKAIIAAMADRPVLMNRAPSLHKFSVMAFQPTLTKSLSIEVPGIIVKPFGLDFDGDTTVLHVPVTEKARKEAFDLMPSKNLYNSRSRELNYTPDQEAIIGLYLLSQSKDGLAKINNLLPKDIEHFTTNVTKSKVASMLAKIAEKHPNDYNDIVTKIKVLGDNHATDAGFSLSLSDMPDNHVFVKQQYKKAMTALHSKSVSDDKKLKLLLEADKNVKSKALEEIGENNNYAIMVNSGGRGSTEQIKQILFAPGLLTDHNGDIIMRPVLNSYAHGLPFADYWTTLYGARKGQLDRQLMTSKPGALNKEVVNTSMNIVTSMNDCGTKHGIPMNTDDPNIVGRYMTNGILITKGNLDSVRKKHHSVEVRSPATCESSHGICQKCYGIDEYNALPKIGSNVGVKAAQAVSEPLTQAAMKTFHMGGTASGGGGVFGGFEHVSNFLQAPETFKNKATLAKISGKITAITPGAAGGWHITINDDQEHFVNPLAGDLIVKKGDSIQKGDAINDGIPHPKDAIDLLGETKGIHRIVDTLHNIYKNSGIQVDRRNVETVVRGMTGFGIVKDEGSHPNLMRGDIIPLSTISEYNSNSNKPFDIDPHDAYGMVLNKDIGKHKAGTRINKTVVKDLTKNHKMVNVVNLPIDYVRTSIGVQQAPLKSQDWLARLGYRYLKRGLQEGATYGYNTDIHGFHPIPAFVTGQLGDPDAHGSY